MNPAALSSAVADVDADLLRLLVKIQAICAALPPGSPVHVALTHSLETIAVLSAGMEDLALKTLQLGADNPSWN